MDVRGQQVPVLYLKALNIKEIDSSHGKIEVQNNLKICLLFFSILLWFTSPDGLCLFSYYENWNLHFSGSPSGHISVFCYSKSQ